MCGCIIVCTRMWVSHCAHTSVVISGLHIALLVVACVDRFRMSFTPCRTARRIHSRSLYILNVKSTTAHLPRAAAHTHTHTHTHTVTHTHTHTHTYTHIQVQRQTVVGQEEFYCCIAVSLCVTCVCVRHTCVCERHTCVCVRHTCVCVRHTCVCVRHTCVCERHTL